MHSWILGDKRPIGNTKKLFSRLVCMMVMVMVLLFLTQRDVVCPWSVEAADPAMCDNVPTARSCLTTVPSAMGDVVFSDDFDDGEYDGWQVENGTWFVRDGSLGAHYTQCGGEGYRVVAGNEGWTDYQLTVDVKRTRGWDDGGILVRHSESGSYTVAIHPIQPYGGSVMLGKAHMGYVAEQSWPFEPDRWYRIKVRVNGPSIEVWLIESTEEILLIDYVDTEPVYTQGKIGFTMWAGALCESEVLFDNVEVASVSQTHYSPDPDGYGFQNGSGPTSWEIFRDTFGTDNVEWSGTGRRKLVAQLYYDHFYKDTGANGNCDAMSVSSMLLYKEWADPLDFLSQMNVDHTVELPISTAPDGSWQSSDVVDFLIRYQGYQRGRQVKQQGIAAQQRSLTDSVNVLKSALDGDTPSPQRVGITGPHGANEECAGHSLMPYGYEVNGDSISVHVYDPNHPRSTSQVLRIEPSREYWTYDNANSLDVWGSAKTCVYKGRRLAGSLDVIPVSTYRDHPIPPWIGGGLFAPRVGVSEESAWYEIEVGEKGTLAIEDSQGRVVGGHGTDLSLGIPGSYPVIPLGAIPGVPPEYPECYVVNSTSPLTIEIQYSEAGELPLYGLMPGGQVEVKGVSSAGQVSDIVLPSPDGADLTVLAGSSGDGREISLLRAASTHDREVTISNVNLTPGSLANLSVVSDGSVITFTSSLAQDDYQIDLKQVGLKSTEFCAAGPEMDGDDVHVIHLDWDDPVTASVAIDHEGDGIIDETVVIDNERIENTYLPIILKND